LITTETGLVIALPGLFFQYHLVRRYERYKAFLTQVQTVCTQTRFQGVRYAVKTGEEALDGRDKKEFADAPVFGAERMASAAS
ncbi:MAG: MotA/TolQ/ExbB proton channel family protein, partial [Planctomycetes bacterium]|nr:MotA/TolQ/ExbB proton channel family protein [Planctomycetota bacterium]